MGASFFFPQRRVEMGSTSGIHHAGRPCGRLCIVLFVFFLISEGGQVFLAESRVEGQFWGV